MADHTERVDVIARSLNDARKNLDACPTTPVGRALRARLDALEAKVRGWKTHRPDQGERAETMQSVLRLALDVMSANGGRHEG